MVISIHESSYPALYPIFVLLGMASMLLFPSSTRGITDPSLRQRYYAIQGITFLGAVAGAKIAVLMGDRHWPIVPVHDFHEVLTAGRSITGALLGGFATAEIVKPLFRYTLPPNDSFAMRIPFSIGVGRLGCLFGGCCRGLPHAGVLALRYEDGVLRYPAQLYEVMFQFAIGVVFVHLVRRGEMKGRVFALYLVAYGAFRFATEFLRETPRYLGTFSVYQVLSVLMVVTGAVAIVLRSRAASVTSAAVEGAAGR